MLSLFSLCTYIFNLLFLLSRLLFFYLCASMISFSISLFFVSIFSILFTKLWFIYIHFFKILILYFFTKFFILSFYFLHCLQLLFNPFILLFQCFYFLIFAFSSFIFILCRLRIVLRVWSFFHHASILDWWVISVNVWTLTDCIHSHLLFQHSSQSEPQFCIFVRASC